MHIAIEGMDGVGKTTAAKMLSVRLGFRLVEKPLHFLLDEQGGVANYLRCRDYINRQVDNDALRAWFYGLGNLLLCHRFNNEDVITDRHLVSNYFWCGGPGTEEIFDCLVGLVGNPDHTFLLYASAEEGARRLLNRDPFDPDIHKVDFYPTSKTKMEAFLQKFQMPYTAIDTTDMEPQEVVESVIRALPESIRAIAAARQ